MVSLILFVAVMLVILIVYMISSFIEYRCEKRKLLQKAFDASIRQFEYYRGSIWRENHSFFLVYV